MKKVFWLLVLNVALLSAKAQTNDVIKITGTKFPFDIMQQWIDVYSKTHPDVHFQLSKAIPADSADLQVAAHGFREGELKENQTIIAVNRYAQLPVVNSRRSDLKALQAKGFTKADIQDIYFKKTENKHDGFNTTANVYKRDKNVCASRSFSENITGVQSDVVGVNVNGDDKALLDAVKKDVDGISYNNLGLVYNINTRKVTDSIAIVPVDLNENGKIDADENIYHTLDDVINYVSKNRNITMIQDNVNIVFNKNTVSKNALHFLSWIITKGQVYNPAFGFINLDKAVATEEQQTLAGFLKNDSSVASK